MRKAFTVLTGLLFVSLSSFSQEGVDWIVQARFGSAYNFRTPLTISQDNYSDIKLKKAKYATRALAGPPYYEFHVIRWKEDRGWGLKITHHKLYLQNNPPDVQQFTITDGYNLITLVREWKIAGFIFHVGGGGVLTHPESTIRWQKFSETEGLFGTGYHISGAVGEAAVEKRVFLTKHFLLSFEGRFTGSFVKVPIAHGHAHTSNLSLHGLGGIGYSF